MEKNDEFLETAKVSIEALGFWREEHKSFIISQIEDAYKKEILRNWYISDIIVNGGAFLIKWEKRILPLSDQDLKEKYGK